MRNPRMIDKFFVAAFLAASAFVVYVLVRTLPGFLFAVGLYHLIGLVL